MYSFTREYEDLKQIFLNELENHLKDISASAYFTIYKSLEYSLTAGGKRIRPVLMLGFAKYLGLDLSQVTPFAVALEMIHTYSLIHDDLPCMDNDSLRRGKPTNHIVFGEANAVLAGDSLLNYAYEICFKQCEKGQEYIAAAKFLSECSGVGGMISGQAADIEGENLKEISLNHLQYIYYNKTVRLIEAAILIPFILSGRGVDSKARQFSENLGFLFQFTDDILDVIGDDGVIGKSTGKDAKSNKLTIIKLLGVEKAKTETLKLYNECLRLLSELGIEQGFLRDITDSIYKREK